MIKMPKRGDSVRVIHTRKVGEVTERTKNYIRVSFPDSPDIWYSRWELEPADQDRALTFDELEYLRSLANKHGYSGHTKAERLILKIVNEYVEVTK